MGFNPICGVKIPWIIAGPSTQSNQVEPKSHHRRLPQFKHPIQVGAVLQRSDVQATPSWCVYWRPTTSCYPLPTNQNILITRCRRSLPPLHRLLPRLTSNPFSILLWSDTRTKQKANFSHTRLPPNSNPATLLPRFCHCCKD